MPEIPEDAKQLTRLIGARVRALARRYALSEAQYLFALTVIIGVVCGLAAVAFHLAIRLCERLMVERALAAHGWWAWTILVPGVVGLLAGVVLVYVVPGARGSGIPQVKAAYALADGKVPFRDALGKFVLGALQIGSGASLGREGPTVQICAGAASLVGRLTSLPKKSLRRLTPVGVAAGIAAAFNAPIAAVTFTIEEIVGDLDQTVLSGVVVAAAVAAVIERSLLGVHPVIEIGQGYGLEHASSLALYALLGVAAALVSVAFTRSLLRLRALFQRDTAVPRWAHPALGGLVAGLLAVIVRNTLGTTGMGGGGYETLRVALLGHIAAGTLAALCLCKLAATVFSYSSGGAGGIFAPTLFMGGMLGGVLGVIDVRALGHHGNELGSFALVGMGAVFAGVVRAPITSVLIIFEMTGGYGLVLPLMIANMISFVLARHLEPVPIYEALLEQDGVVLPQRRGVALAPDRLEALMAAPVRGLGAMRRPIARDARLPEIIDALLAERHGVLPVRRAAAGLPIGLIQLEDLRDVWRDDQLGAMLVAADVARDAPELGEDASVGEAIALMDRVGVGALCVGAAGPDGDEVELVARVELVRVLAGRVTPGPTDG